MIYVPLFHFLSAYTNMYCIKKSSVALFIIVKCWVVLNIHYGQILCN